MFFLFLFFLYILNQRYKNRVTGNSKIHKYFIFLRNLQLYFTNFANKTFYTPVWKTGHIMETPAVGGGLADGRAASTGFPLFKSKVFIRSLSNLVNMLVGILSWPSSITCQIPPNGICSQSWISCSQKCCHYHWNYYKYDRRILCQFGTLVRILWAEGKCVFFILSILSICVFLLF